MTRTWQRWLPAGLVPAIIAAGALVGSAQAGAVVNLPDTTPEQVLAMVGQNPVQALSGTLEQTAQLGLPQLPTGGPSASSDAASVLDLLTGSHTARVYQDGPTSFRGQVMDQLAERDVVRHGTDVWVYSSQDNTATHVTLPTDDTGTDPAVQGDVPTPAQLAHQFLTTIDPSTQVTVGRDTTVAGRTAYDLVLMPRGADTLVGSVSIAVDSETGLPLRVEVQARGQHKPAFQLAFTALTLRTPAADRFQFVPPPGATVREQALPVRPPKQARPAPSGLPSRPPVAQPTVSGTGWDAVLEVPVAASPPQLSSSPLRTEVTRAVRGGRLLHTALVNMLLTDDGRVFAGSVPVERLQAAAARP